MNRNLLGFLFLVAILAASCAGSSLEFADNSAPEGNTITDGDDESVSEDEGEDSEEAEPVRPVDRAIRLQLTWTGEESDLDLWLVRERPCGSAGVMTPTGECYRNEVGAEETWFCFECVTDADCAKGVCNEGVCAKHRAAETADTCSGTNLSPDWGVIGESSDNPQAVGDYMNSRNIEELSYANPVAGRFRVAILNYGTKAGIVTTATLTVSIGGVECGVWIMPEMEPADLWRVLDIVSNGEELSCDSLVEIGDVFTLPEGVRRLVPSDSGSPFSIWSDDLSAPAECAGK